MKITYHIPTEQYGFVELEDDHNMGLDRVPSYEEVKASVVAKIDLGEGLDHLDWNRALDGYMTLRTLPSEVYEKMNEKQQLVIQELKKHFKRIQK